jgi:hypothetical protein
VQTRSDVDVETAEKKVPAGQAAVCSVQIALPGASAK